MVKIRLETKRGIRRQEVSQANLKKYKQIDDFFVRLRPVKEKSGKRKLKPIRSTSLEKDYVFDYKTNSYVKKDASTRIIEVKTDTGKRLVTMEQLKYLFKKEGKKYIQSEPYKRVVMKSVGENTKYQAIVKFRFEFKGKVLVQDGFSHIYQGNSSIKEAKSDAMRSAIYRLLEYQGVTATSDELRDLADISVVKIEYHRIVS